MDIWHASRRHRVHLGIVGKTLCHSRKDQGQRRALVPVRRVHRVRQLLTDDYCGGWEEKKHARIDDRGMWRQEDWVYPVTRVLPLGRPRVPVTNAVIVQVKREKRDTDSEDRTRTQQSARVCVVGSDTPSQAFSSKTLVELKRRVRSRTRLPFFVLVRGTPQPQ